MRALSLVVLFCTLVVLCVCGVEGKLHHPAAAPVAPAPRQSPGPMAFRYLHAPAQSYLRYKLSLEKEFANNATLIEVAMEEYASFLHLVHDEFELKHHNGSAEAGAGALTPSHLVDLVWHTHILHTRFYIAMCREHFFGQYVHHVPSVAPQTADENKAGFKAYEHTMSKYEQRFGQTAPTDVWPSATGSSDAYPCTSGGGGQPSSCASGGGSGGGTWKCRPACQASGGGAPGGGMPPTAQTSKNAFGCRPACQSPPPSNCVIALQ